MGYFKDLQMEFDETYNIDSESDMYSLALNLWIKQRVTSTINVKEELKEFFKDIFPTLNNSELIWCMASSSQGEHYNFSYSDPEQALRNLSLFADENVNLFFSPAIFKGWRKDSNVIKINTIYIDIDDVDGIDFSEMNRENIKDWLIDTYCLNDDVLPDWIVASGHGLHFYWIVQEIDLKTEEGTKLREKYTDYLITHFKADIACRNKSRILRFPTSKNVKDMSNIKQTRLFRINSSKHKEIERLDFFKCSDEEIDAYVKDNLQRRAEKRKATMMKNKTLKEKESQSEEIAEEKKIPEKCLSGENSDTTVIKAAIPNKESKAEETEQDCPIVFGETIKTPLSPKRRYLRIIRDLQNYALRRGKVPEGYRSSFCHIAAVYCKKAKFNIKSAEAIIYACVEDGFINEAEKIIQLVYHSKTEYTYKNEKIAELLDFNDFDLENSYSYYTEEQKKEARRKKYNRYDDKRYRESRNQKSDQKEYRRKFVEEHEDMTATEIAKVLGCSERTVRYIRAGLRKDE